MYKYIDVVLGLIVRSSTGNNSPVDAQCIKLWCRDWGEWVDRAALRTGYPTQSSTVGIQEAVRSHRAMKWPLPGGGSYRYALPSRHVILCADMPQRLLAIHQAILRLPPESKAVLSLWYAYQLRADGTPWSRYEKAVHVGMTYSKLEHLVRRARKRLRKTFTKNVDKAANTRIDAPTVGKLPLE